MTIFAALSRRRVPLSTLRERIDLPDGDFIDLDWVGDRAKESAPLVLVLHGLEGSIESDYARGLLREVESRGWRGVLMHFRGCSGEPNRLERAYHSGETGDLRELAAILSARFPHAPLLAVGYSLGGNVLLKYLGEEGKNSRVAAAVAVSVPMMLAPCADRLRRGFSRVYQEWLLHSLKASYRKKREHRELSLRIEDRALRRLTTLREFDDRITGPIHGFAGADDYYARSSSRPFLRAIRTPTWIIQAKDDPFMTEAVIPSAGELSSAVTLELFEHGGHVGFIAGRNPFAPRYWLEDQIPIIFEAALARRALHLDGGFLNSV